MSLSSICYKDDHGEHSHRVNLTIQPPGSLFSGRPIGSKEIAMKVASVPYNDRGGVRL
jgi:hypothetical protein